MEPASIAAHLAEIEQMIADIQKEKEFMDESLHKLEDQVIIHAEEHGAKDLGSFASLVAEVASRKPKPPNIEAEKIQAFAVDVNSQLEIECDVSLEEMKQWRNLKDPSVQKQIGAVIQRAGEVRMTKLDRDDQKTMRGAMDGEIKAWMKYHATKAAARANYKEEDIMKMRWILRFKENGAAKARLVIIGYQDPRIGKEVRTEAPVVSKRGRNLYLTKVAQKRFKLRKGDVKNAFLQGHQPAEDVQELVAEPVPELAEYMGLSADEVVVLTKFCYGLIDAPRQWWLTLQGDLLKAGWRKCKLEPCMMTMWEGDVLIGILCYHVDDIMIAGDENNKKYLHKLEELQGLYEWGSWEEQCFEMCGCRIEQEPGGNITLDQTKYARAIEVISMSAHRRKHEHETLTYKEHRDVIAKRGELSWLAQQSMVPLMAPLSLIDASEKATGKTLHDLNTLVRMAHANAEDKLHFRKLDDPIFLTFADAAWANRRDMTSQCGYLVVATERSILTGSSAPTCPIAWHSKQCPRVARSSGSAETQGAAQAQEEMEYVRLMWAELEYGDIDLTKADETIAKTTGVLVIDAKGVYDSITRSESAALSMSDKRSAVEGLALRESIGRTRTLLKWVHSEINVADGLTKFDHRAQNLVRDFLRSGLWRIFFDPTFTSARKVKAQKTIQKKGNKAQKKPRSEKSRDDDVADQQTEH